MAIGDAAAAAGFPLVAATAKVKDGYVEINRTRDIIAERTSVVQPVSKGGTGATTPAQARTNLGAAATTHTHSWAQITSGVPATFPPRSHTHDDRYYTETESNSRFAARVHTHDDRYFTEAEANDRFSLLTHNHDSRYYTRSQVDDRLDAKPDRTTAQYNADFQQRDGWIAGHEARLRALESR